MGFEDGPRSVTTEIIYRGTAARMIARENVGIRANPARVEIFVKLPVATACEQARRSATMETQTVEMAAIQRA